MCPVQMHPTKLRPDLSLVAPKTLIDFSPRCVRALNRILLSGVEVVVSSDWNRWASLEDIQAFYLSQGVVQQPIGFTPFCPRTNLIFMEHAAQQQREMEIKQWLKENTVSGWVAVDDLLLDLENFVWVSDTTMGLAQEGIEEEVMNLFE